MKDSAIIAVTEQLKTQVVYKTFMGLENVPFICDTAIAYDIIDENGTKYLETDFEKFPSSCSKKHILECIENGSLNLGKVRKVNYRYFKDKTFVIADIETTGFSTNMGAEIIQIGALKIDEFGNEVDRFDKFIKPVCKKIPKKIVELTGITDEDVKNADPVSVVIREFIQFFKGSTIVFHNKMFDWDRFLIPFCAKYGYLIPELYPCLDTKIISRKLFPDESKHDLEALCDRLNIEIKDHHNAFADVVMTAQIFMKLREMEKDKWENFPYIRWISTAPPSHNIRVTRVNRWDKWMPKKKCFSRLRFYVDFIIDGKYGRGFYDAITKEWIVTNTTVSFDSNDLEPATFQYLKISSYEELEEVLPSKNKPEEKFKPCIK